MTNLTLTFAWGVRAKLLAEGDKLWAEGDKLLAEGAKLRAKGDKLRAKGDKLWAKGDKLRDKGDKLWADAVIAVFGNVAIYWTYKPETDDYDCDVNGEKFEAVKLPKKGGAG